MKTWQRNLLSLLFIVVGGFVLFNFAFMLAALVIKASMSIMGLPQDSAPPFLSKVIYVILIAIISLFIFKSKLNTLVKATYLTLPLMVVQVSFGIVLYQQSKFLLAVIAALILGALLLYFYKKKLSWQYYFATLYVAVLGLIIMAFNIQIGAMSRKSTN